MLNTRHDESTASRRLWSGWYWQPIESLLILCLLILLTSNLKRFSLRTHSCCFTTLQKWVGFPRLCPSSSKEVKEMKRIPWVSGIALIIVMFSVMILTRPVKAQAPCIANCSNAQYWASNYCYSIGCWPAPTPSFFCGTNQNGIGGYSFSCQCTCDGHLCGTGDSGTINPSCQNPCIPGVDCP
jgi:hypothetical protein